MMDDEIFQELLDEYVEDTLKGMTTEIIKDKYEAPFRSLTEIQMEAVNLMGYLAADYPEYVTDMSNREFVSTFVADIWKVAGEIKEESLKHSLRGKLVLDLEDPDIIEKLQAIIEKIKLRKKMN